MTYDLASQMLLSHFNFKLSTNRAEGIAGGYIVIKRTMYLRMEDVFHTKTALRRGVNGTFVI